MACYHPLQAWQLDSGEVVFAERGRVKRPLTLPCGQCVGCRLERSRQWAVRIMHEAQCHASNAFVTLTYSDEHLPQNGSLLYRDFQLFAKRLRKQNGHLRYFVAGEYGEQFGRPHWHACLFGVEFTELQPIGKTDSGSMLFRSPSLELLWPYGFSSVGELTFESAAYVARYVMKKVTGKAAEDHYKKVNEETGELVDVEPELCRMSLRPGIGYEWFRRFSGDVENGDYVIVRGRKAKPPRYYDRISDGDADGREYARYLRSLELTADSSPERLRAREEVAKARLRFSKRKLK